jgi:PhnB protein
LLGGRPGPTPVSWAGVTGIQPELWVDRAGAAVAFYQAAFGATVLHRVGEGDDIVAQLCVDGAAFWVAAADSTRRRFSPDGIGGATGRTLLVVDDPDAIFRRAVGAGASPEAPVGDEHGWRLGRIIDPFGHEWEIGRPIAGWPPPGLMSPARARPPGGWGILAGRPALALLRSGADYHSFADSGSSPASLSIRRARSTVPSRAIRS